MREGAPTITRTDARPDMLPPRTPPNEDQAAFNREFDDIVAHYDDEPIDHSSDEPPQPPPAEPIPPTGELPRPETNARPELKLVMVDQTKDAWEFAQDAADARLTRELNQGGKIKRFFKGIWQGNFAKDHYRREYAREAHAAIIADQDVLVHAESLKDKRNAAMRSTIERFGHDLGEQLIDRNKDDTLEKYTLHNPDSNFSRGVKGFIRHCVDQGLENDAIQEEYTRFAKSYREQNPDDKTVGEGVVQLSNITELIKTTKSAIEHGESLDNLVEGMKIVTGEARTGARTEARQTIADKAVEFMSKRKMTAWIPEGAITIASSVASFFVRAGSSKTVGILTSPFTLGLSLLAPAIVGGVRESWRVKAEHNQHSREMAMGGQEIDTPTTPQTRTQRLLAKLFGNRREKMERARLKTLSAKELFADLQSKRSDILLDDADRPPGTTKDDALRAALDALAALEVYTQASNDKKKDLIEYDETASIPEQRLQLALLRAELKVTLGRELDDATKARLGFAGEANVDAILNRQATSTIEAVATDAKDKRKALKKLRRRRIALMAAGAVLVGASIGMVAQEGFAALSSTNGVVERAWGGGGDLHNGVNHQSLAERLINGSGDPGHHGPSSEYTSTSVGEHGTIKLSNDHTLVANSDGTFNFVDPNGNITVDHLPINPDGSLSPESKQLLESKGMEVRDVSTVIDKTTYEDRPVTFDEYMDNHQGDTTHVKRDLWYDNDTTAPVFDKNELGLHRGGADGSGVLEDGSYEMRAAMREEGSYHADQVANYLQLAREGKLKIALSPTAGTQSTPFMVDAMVKTVPEIQRDGTVKMVDSVVANIQPDSPAGRFLSIENGKLENHGRYMEFVQLTDLDEQGVQHIRPLATWVGQDKAAGMSLIDRVPIPAFETHPAYEIITSGYETPPSFVEIPPSWPVTRRKSLEVLRSREPANRERPNNYNYGSGYPGPVTGEWHRQMENDRMPELRRDPSARVSLADGVRWHHELTKRKNSTYAKEIEDLVATLPNMAKLDARTSTIVPILVGASFEQDNIYRTLSLYAQMPASWKAESQLVLHVNWVDAKENDPIEKAKIDKTRAEVARAMRDFPDLQISQFESIWSQEKIDKGEYGDRLIAHAAQKLVDVSMEAAHQAIEAGRMPEDHDILLWKGDADAQGMGRNAGPNMTKAFKDHPEADAFSGGVRWGTEKYKDLPGLGVVLNFMEIYRIAAQRAHIQGFQSTFGVNGGARMSTFAAIGGIGHYSDQRDSPPDDGWGDRLFAARNPTLTGTAAPYGASGGREAANNDYHRHVGGASIDTDASRFEKVWTSGEPITSIWGNVNENGYQGRTTGLKPGQKEDLRRNPDEVIARIEYNMSDLISHWTAEPAQVSTALAVMLPGPKDLGGRSAYTITRSPDGESKFSLTPQGKKWLIRRLQYNSEGKHDPYGDRQARQLYGRTKKRGKRRFIPVKQAASRMVAGRT